MGKRRNNARNEKRFVHQMQQGKWDYKSDGIKQLKYNLVSVEEITPKLNLSTLLYDFTRSKK